MRSCWSGQGVEVFSFRLVAESSEVEALRQLLSKDELERADRFTFERDRVRFIVGRARMRSFLAERIGLEPSEIRFVYGPFGKPALADDSPARSVSFNLSHSGELGVLAYAACGSVGVDVEEVQQISWMSEVARRVFSAKEQAEFVSLPESERVPVFLAVWTRKEAVMKALGTGLTRPPHTIEVSMSPELTAPECSPVIDGMERRDISIATFLPGEGYVGAVAVRMGPGEQVGGSPVSSPEKPR